MYSTRPDFEESHGDLPSEPVPRWPLAALGDICAVIVFVLIGRSSHGEGQNAVMGTIGTALPFLTGLAISTITLRGYARSAFSTIPSLLKRTALVWALADLIALAIRSVLERRVAPLSFAVVSYVAALLLLSVWRSAFRWLVRLV